MAVVSLITHTELDLAAFAKNCKVVMGRNPITVIDNRPGPTELHDYTMCLREFSGSAHIRAESLMHFGFMFAGRDHELLEIVEYASGMSLITCGETVVPDLVSAIITGSLMQWRDSIKMASKAHELSVARQCFGEIRNILVRKGFAYLLGGDYDTDRKRLT